MSEVKQYNPAISLDENVRALKADKSNYQDDVAIIKELIKQKQTDGVQQLSRDDIITSIVNHGYASSEKDANNAYNLASTIPSYAPPPIPNAKPVTTYETDFLNKDTTVGQIENNGGKCAYPKDNNTILVLGGRKSRKQTKKGGKRASLKKSKKTKGKSQKKSRKSRGKK